MNITIDTNWYTLQSAPYRLLPLDALTQKPGTDELFFHTETDWLPVNPITPLQAYSILIHKSNEIDLIPYVWADLSLAEKTLIADGGSPEFRYYLHLRDSIREMRFSTGGFYTEMEDRVLDRMTALWYGMLESERDMLRDEKRAAHA
jgi:hypothetical protein